MNRILIIAGSLCLAGVSFAQGIGPSPYLQTSDSPWAAYVGSSGFFLEDFEDGLLNTPGVTASTGNPIGPGGLTDSVDGDDGSVQENGATGSGNGTNGRSFFSGGGSNGITFTFDSNILGFAPTMAGIVWTDGAGTIEFEAFDTNGISLGTLSGSHATSGFSGQTDEDRFYGWESAGGIGSIFIRNTSGGIEVDHLQYGVVPEPATMTLLGLGALAALRRKKKK